jgi:hypothetical protein
MKVSSPVGDFPFEPERLQIEGARLTLYGRRVPGRRESRWSRPTAFGSRVSSDLASWLGRSPCCSWG